MTISYNWLCEYLPMEIAPEKLSAILTSIGLEVESLEKRESIKGGLAGLITGEVIACEKHPDADKLSLTKVSTGNGEPLLIVCGAPNVAAGQKVIVAPVGCTIFPTNGEPFTIKKAKIRGQESQGMICAEDEIGLGDGHEGIKVLPPDTPAGIPLDKIYSVDTDHIIEIGLTPNHMDAMSHLGVARDVCAWWSYHHKENIAVKSPLKQDIPSFHGKAGIAVTIENKDACKRYSGITISNVTVTESPEWIKNRLKSIGLKPINNIVDITNFILHETGQPLHAFDADKISGKKIIVKTLPAGTKFVTLDEKERTLKSDDLMICDEKNPLCIAGVYGGMNSGVINQTKNIFLESACFDATYIRRTSVAHELRTDAASRFEKGTDISITVPVLVRAAMLMAEIGGGKLTEELVDVYPKPLVKKELSLPYNYLQKLSGKQYPAVAVKNIFESLGFGISKTNEEAITVTVPFHKTDIHLPADLVEEIMRIDGLDNIVIPSSIRISPGKEADKKPRAMREKCAAYLCGLGFHEIFTNSISNSAFYTESQLEGSVKMINSLSSELDMLRPQMLESGLEVIAHNLNRKNLNLRLYEFGKTYQNPEALVFKEVNHLALYLTGSFEEPGWQSKPAKADLFYLKGIINNLLLQAGVLQTSFNWQPEEQLIQVKSGRSVIGNIKGVSAERLKRFDIRQPVYFADIQWDDMLSLKQKPIQYREISKYPVVNRDLALVVDKNVSYSDIEQIALSGKIVQLQSVQLFDVFESDKLGPGKKSMAISLTFADENKTMTDSEIETYMQTIISALEKGLQASVRK